MERHRSDGTDGEFSLAPLSRATFPHPHICRDSVSPRVHPYQIRRCVRSAQRLAQRDLGLTGVGDAILQIALSGLENSLSGGVLQCRLLYPEPDVRVGAAGCLSLTRNRHQ